jgi:hypothetical protein
MSFYDRKALVILSVLWYIVKNNLTKKKEKVLKRIEQVMHYYKIGMKKRDQKWIRHHVMKFQAEFVGAEINQEVIISLIFMVAEYYRERLKSPARIAVWDILESYCVLIGIVEYNTENLEKSERFFNLLINDVLYYK